MVIVYFLLFSLALPFYMFAKKGKDNARYIPFSLLASIVMLMPFVFLSMHRIAAYIVFFIDIILYALAILELQKNKRALLEFFEPAILLYIFVVPILYIITKKSSPMLWDELRLWAAVPKHLYFSGISHIGLESFIYTEMQNYPPAMPVFQLLVMYMQGFWSDNILFFAYAALSASFFISVVPTNKWSYFALPLLLALSVFLPQSYANSYEFDSNFYYTTLFIDYFIGFLIAYLFIMLYKNPFKNTESVIGFTLVLTVLTMSKESGVFLLGLILVFVLIMYLSYMIRNKKYISILAIALPAIFFVVFRGILIYSGVKEPSAFTLANIVEVLRNPNMEQSYMLKDFFKTVINNFMVLQGNATVWWNISEFFTPLVAFCFSILLSACAILISKKEERKVLALTSFFMELFVVIYYISLLPVYLLKIGYADFEFASLQRYLSTAFFAHLFFSVYMLIEAVLKLPSVRKTVVLAISIALIVLLFPIGEIKTIPYEYERETGKQNAIDIANEAEPNSKVFLIMNNSAGEDILIHHQTYYALLENNINIDNTMYEIDWIGNPDTNLLASKLHNYDYCYLYADYENIFRNQHESIFQTEITYPKLYRIEKSESSVVLK